MIPVGGEGSIGFHPTCTLRRGCTRHCDPDGERQRDEEERRKINEGQGERLNVRPTSINIHWSRRRRSSRLARFCTRPAKISARQYRTMADCRHYGGHCRGLDMSPVASGIQAAISWPSLTHLSIPLSSPILSLSLEIQEKRFAWKREKDLSLTGHRFVAELRSGDEINFEMKLREKVNF